MKQLMFISIKVVEMLLSYVRKPYKREPRPAEPVPPLISFSFPHLHGLHQRGLDVQSYGCIL